MLDNRYALLFIRGERPLEDFKYDILKHPNIALTTDGGAEPYRHGEDLISIAALSIDERLLKKASMKPVSDEEYLFFSEEELEELLHKKMEEKKHEQEKYILWSNILDLRSRGINIARTARRLGVSRNTVRHLQSLSLEEVLQHKERHYKLHAYEQAVASLLTSFPSISSSRIGDYLREHYPDFPHVCEKTVHNYVQFVRKKHHIPPAR